MAKVAAAIEGFPRDELLELLKRARAMFASEEAREVLRTSLHLAPGEGERQQRQPSAGGVDLDVADRARPLSARRFATALVDDVARPSNLDAAVTLARRAIAGIDQPGEERWSELVSTLQRLQREERARSLYAEEAPDLETYRQWSGFECLHHYSLTDRFFGREDVLRQLDDWAAGDDPVSVQCLCALGGAGKSAVAWRWVNGALTRLRHGGYRGVFWCSFYEKSFDFNDFVRRALVFCTQVDENDVVALNRREVESQLLKALRQERFLLVVDGLERVMTGYAQVADRAVDEEGVHAGRDLERAPAADRRLTDPRSGAFLRRLASQLSSRILITTRLEPAELEQADRGGPRRHVGFIRLPGLDVSDAEALWDSLAPDCPLTEELDAIFALCGYHPLAISILARSVAARGGDWAAWRRVPAHAGFAPSGSEARARAHIIGTCLRDLGEESYDVLGVLTASGKPMTLVELGEVLRQGSIANGEEGWTVAGSVEAELDRLVSLGFIGEATVDGTAEYDVHPVVRGAVWSAMSDPRRERFIDHALSEFSAIPDPQRPLDAARLHKATSLFKLLVTTQQWDRAWEMFAYKLWWPMSLQGAYRELLDLFELLLVSRDPLQLLPLSSRREQANATGMLASLLMQAGDGDSAETLLRWSGAIRLRINDFLGFLDTRHSRTWQMLYEGRLFETEAELRHMKLQAVEFGALDLLAPIDCWIGIVLALRGEREAARLRFGRPDGRTTSFRWWAQGIAEGQVYLDEPNEALRWVGETTGTAESPGDERLQNIWECLTRGMAFFARDDHVRANEELAIALRESRQTTYAIIECFALPYLAEIRLVAGEPDEAAELIDQYFQVDPESQYRLAAADAWRVRALCALERGDRDAAQKHASLAYQAAACEGPPFVYVAALNRANDVLERVGAYVPRTRTHVPPDWAEQLRFLEAEEKRLMQALRDPRRRRRRANVRRRYQAERAMRKADLRYAASEEDQRWWDLVAGTSHVLTDALSETMHALSIDIAALREAFEGSEHKSLEVVFYELDAARVIRPHEPRRFGNLSDDEQEAWIGRADDHAEALDAFLGSEIAELVAGPFELELELDDRGAEAFLADCKRRIGIAAASPRPRRWWAQLEERRPPGALLVVAEAIQAVPATIEEFVDAISITGERGLEYALYRLQVERAIARQRVNALSKAEGWPLLQIHLRLQAVKYQLGWADLDEDVREFWSRLERRNDQQVGRLLHLAEELALRGSSIAEYYDAYLRSNTDNIQASLCYLDYMRLAEQAWGGASWPEDISVQRWTYDTATPTFTDTASWSSEQLARRRDVLRERVGYADAPPAAREWWASLEGQTTIRTMIRLAEELDTRDATIAELHLAHVDGGTDNLLAALGYVDFSRLRQFDEHAATERAKAHNERANAHYEDESYAAAIEEYEAAIAEDGTISTYYSNLAGAWEMMKEGQTKAKRNALDALTRGVAACTDTSQLDAKIAQIERWLRVFGRRGGTDDVAQPVIPVAVELSDSLVEHGHALVAACDPLRAQIRERLGVNMPGVRFRGNPNLAPGTYTILLDEVTVAVGTFVLGHVLVTDVDRDGEAHPEREVEGRHPEDGRPGFWIEESRARSDGERGLGAVDFIIAHLAGVATANLARFLTEQEVNNELELSWARPLDPAREPGLLTGFTATIRGMVEEGVPVLEFDTLLDEFRAVTEAGGDVDQALQTLRRLPGVRASLPGNRLGASHLRLDEDLEDRIRAGLQRLGQEHVATLAPETVHDFLAALRSALGGDCLLYEHKTLVLRDGLVRRYARLIASDEFPHLAVIADAELETAPTIVATVSLAARD